MVAGVGTGVDADADTETGGEVVACFDADSVLESVKGEGAGGGKA